MCDSRCAEAPLGVAHRFAPSRVHAAGITLSGLRWVRSHSRRRSPVAFAPYAPPSGSLVAVVAPWHWSGASRRVSGQWPAASHLYVPRPPVASPLRGIGPALGARPPPRGSLSPALDSRRLTTAACQCCFSSGFCNCTYSSRLQFLQVAPVLWSEVLGTRRACRIAGLSLWPAVRGPNF